jgi:uncharacterized tellurite resistance protein B-like protein
MPEPGNWILTMDRGLQKLDQLKSAEKEKLVRALIDVVLHDGRLVPSELELLRASCELIHVPMPLLSRAD